MGLFDGIVRIVNGNVAHDAADSGNPLKIGGKARTSRPAAVAASDRVDAWLDQYGAVWTNPHRRFTYVYFYPNTIVGSAADILVDRNDGSYAWPLADTITTGSKANEYFQGSNAAMDDSRIEFYIPLLESDYSRCEIMLHNNLGVSLTVDAYLIPANVSLVSTTAVNAGAYRHIGAATTHTVPDWVGVAEDARLYISVGHGTDDVAANRIATDAIGGGVLLRVKPASDPSSGEWFMTIMRSQ